MLLAQPVYRDCFRKRLERLLKHPSMMHDFAWLEAENKCPHKKVAHWVIKIYSKANRQNQSWPAMHPYKYDQYRGVLLGPL